MSYFLLLLLLFAQTLPAQNNCTASSDQALDKLSPALMSLIHQPEPPEMIPVVIDQDIMNLIGKSDDPREALIAQGKRVVRTLELFEGSELKIVSVESGLGYVSIWVSHRMLQHLIEQNSPDIKSFDIYRGPLFFHRIQPHEALFEITLDDTYPFDDEIYRTLKAHRIELNPVQPPSWIIFSKVSDDNAAFFVANPESIRFSRSLGNRAITRSRIKNGIVWMRKNYVFTSSFKK